jgi:1-acyl-sn-glycerol-3-phosphate acyltransferase
MATEQKRRFSQKIADACLRLAGWQVVGEYPDFPKSIVIGAHHTTNWDFVFAMLLKFSIGKEFHWIGKDSIFRWPLGGLARALGGIPVRRDRKTNFVYQIVEAFQKAEELLIVIAPEGTRKQAPYWKSGFYYMAVGAQVPIVMGFVDYSRKQVGFGPSLFPSGDIQADFAQMRAFYADKQGLYPQNHSPVVLRPVESGGFNK